MDIAINLVFHEKTKHIKLDCYFVRGKVQKGSIVTKHIANNGQLGIFLQSLCQLGC